MSENIRSFKKIHILGASGSGTTTLAMNLIKVLPHKHFDSDDFFWKNKYTQPWPRETRLSLLREELESIDQWILSGAVIDWGNPLIPLFDLVIFLSVPDETRIERLKRREKDRYGDRILAGNDKYEEFNKFIEWASSYENGGIDIRSRLQQETWIDNLSCPILRVTENSSSNQNLIKVLEYLSRK